MPLSNFDKFKKCIFEIGPNTHEGFEQKDCIETSFQYSIYLELRRFQYSIYLEQR